MDHSRHWCDSGIPSQVIPLTSRPKSNELTNGNLFFCINGLFQDQANVLQHFIDNYEEIQRKLKSANFQITVPEPIQVPYTYTNDMREMRDIALQSRTAGDGAEAKDLVAMELSKELSAVSTKKHEESSSFSVIAAKFSPVCDLIFFDNKLVAGENYKIKCKIFFEKSMYYLICE